MSIQLKQLKNEWIGYILIDKIRIHAELGTFEEVYWKIRTNFNELSKRL